MPRNLRIVLLVVATITGAVACGRDLLGPGGRRAGAVRLNPSFPSLRLDGHEQPLSVGSIISFTRVRIVLGRANGDTVFRGGPVSVVATPASSSPWSAA